MPELPKSSEPEFALPPLNPYLAPLKELSLIKNEKKETNEENTPFLLEESNQGQLFYRFDDSFKVPKIRAIYFVFTEDFESKSKVGQVFVNHKIWIRLFRNYARELIWLGEQAMISVSMKRSYKGY